MAANFALAHAFQNTRPRLSRQIQIEDDKIRTRGFTSVNRVNEVKRLLTVLQMNQFAGHAMFYQCFMNQVRIGGIVLYKQNRAICFWIDAVTATLVFREG